MKNLNSSHFQKDTRFRRLLDLRSLEIHCSFNRSNMRASILLSLSAIAFGQSAFAQMLSQIGDGQVQAAVGTSTPAAATTAGLVSQISDHQPQAPTKTATAPAPEATTAGLVSQISDHQPQAPTETSTCSTEAATTESLVTQISDHQPQAPVTSSSAAASPTTSELVSQLTEGQPQAPKTVTPEASTSLPVFISSSNRSHPSLMSALVAVAGLTLAAAIML
jgi:hypothetical protein